jgi:hypothetical protein
LLSLDPGTGEATLIGPTGFTGIRSMTAVTRSGCYPDCKCCLCGTIYCSPPLLNVSQFSCFLTKFAYGHPYANCDASTQQPVLNVADFSCFLQKFTAGCP